jgi:hypothetical protein
MTAGTWYLSLALDTVTPVGHSGLACLGNKKNARNGLLFTFGVLTAVLNGRIMTRFCFCEVLIVLSDVS